MSSSQSVAREQAKVAHLTSVHSPFDVRIFHKECRSLARHGYRVVLVACHDRDEKVDGVKIKAIKRNQGRLLRMTLGVWQVFREALRQNADIYHFHDPELIPIGLLLRLSRKKVIYDIHEDLPQTISYKHYLPLWVRRPLRWLTEMLESAASRRFTALITATPMIAQRFRQRNSRIVIVHNFPTDEGTDLALQMLWEKRALCVAYVGGITTARGICELVRAMSMLPSTHPARLILAGSFSPSGLQGEVSEIPGWERVDYLGLLNHKQVAEMLGRVRAGLVVLHPETNYVHAMPIKLFEYMLAGIPVIASDFPGWRQIIQEAHCGLLVNPVDPAEIASAIEYLLDHPAEAQQMGENGRAAVKQRYTWSSEEQRLLELYNSLVAVPVTPATLAA